MRQNADEAVGAVYRTEWDVLPQQSSVQEAFAAALNQWRASGVPEFP